MDVKPHLLFSLGSHSKQGGDERDLPQEVSFFGSGTHKQDMVDCEDQF
jgi:hypothetical protein